MGKNYIFLSFIYLLTVITWLFVEPIDSISIAKDFSQLVGALSLVGFSYVNFISTRHPLVDRLFNGLDKAYAYHKWVGIVSIILVIAHIGILAVNGGLIISRGVVSPEDAYGMIGWGSTILFIIFITIAILAKSMNYETWKFFHKFLILPYFIGIEHYYRCSDYAVFSLSPFSIWINLINLIGIASVIYSIFIYERKAFKYHYKISQIRTIAKDTIEITGNATGKDLDFNPGQFTFLKLLDKSAKFPSHPFTISQAPKQGEIQFAIKNLGDHTAKLISNVKIGDEFVVTRAHGLFDYSTGCRQQIWIAGGIGITPFRAFYQAGIPAEFSIDFFYAYNTEAEGPYLEEIKAWEQGGNLRLHLIDCSQKGFLTVEKLKESIDTKDPVDVYFCGPKPMRENLRKNLKNSDISVLNFHFDEFEFK